MLEYAPVLVAIAAIIPKLRGKKNERAKIEEVFENLRFAVGTGANIKLPEFKKKFDTEDARRYEYWLPSGLVIPDKLAHILSQTLNKPVEVSGENVMSIWVYKSKLPTKWSYDDVPDKEGWIVPIGKSYKEMIWHDFENIPHMTVAGTTRFGKTVLMKNIMTYLIEHNAENVRFFIIDLKGGLEFFRYEKLKQVEGVATNAQEASDLLKDILNEINSTMDYYREHHITNVVHSSIKKRTFIIIDEGAQFLPRKSAKQKEKDLLNGCLEAIQEICRISGGLGYRQIYATQYPTVDSLPKHVKMNSDAKISFRLPAGYASEVAIDEYGAEKLERAGQAIYKTHDRVKLQVPFLSDKNMWERLRRYEVEKSYIEDAEGGGDTNDIGSIRIHDETTTTDNE